MTTVETLKPGDRVTVEAAIYAFGPSFLAGAGTVLENRDLCSALRKEVLIRFDSEVTGLFGARRLMELLK